MFKPNSDIISEPGVKYLELMGTQILRNTIFMRLAFLFMGLCMLITGIVLSILDLMDYLVALYYILISMGGILILIFLLQSIFGVNRRYFNKIRDLRDSGSAQELKSIAYGGFGIKKVLAIYALVDLGEMSLSTLGPMYGSSFSKRSMYDD